MNLKFKKNYDSYSGSNIIYLEIIFMCLESLDNSKGSSKGSVLSYLKKDQIFEAETPLQIQAIISMAKMFKVTPVTTISAKRL